MLEGACVASAGPFVLMVALQHANPNAMQMAIKAGLINCVHSQRLACRKLITARVMEHVEIKSFMAGHSIQ